MKIKLNPSVLTALLSVGGGGIAGAFAAAMDPNKYRFPEDFGSGKLWKFFLQGAITVGLALFIKSKLGQQVMATFKETQEQLKDGQQIVTQTKVEISEAVKPKK